VAEYGTRFSYCGIRVCNRPALGALEEERYMTRSLGIRRLLPVAVAALVTALIVLAVGGLVPPFHGLQQATAQDGGRYHALIFSRTTGFRHTEAINAGHAAFDEMADAENFDVTHSEDPGLFTDHNL